MRASLIFIVQVNAYSDWNQQLKTLTILLQMGESLNF